MSDLSFLHSDAAEELAQLHFFSIKRPQPQGEIEIRITVREFAIRNAQGMKFFAQTDQVLNQASIPFQPFGWGETLSEALGECLRLVRRH